MRKINFEELIKAIPKGYNHKLINNTKDIYITNALPTMDANPESIVFIDSTRSNEEKHNWINNTKAKLIISDINISIDNKVNIVVEDPKLLFSFIVNKFFVQNKEKKIHTSAVISTNAIIGKDCYIGPNTIIDENVIIGNNCIIEGNVTIYSKVSLGNNVKIQSGSVIGGEGFGYLRSTDFGTVNFPHVGGVIIEDNVHIGVNTCIDRGALGNTILKRDSKVDNLVHIAHNVVIGEGSWVIANAMVAGSVKIGKNTWVAPSSCLRDSISIGDNVTVGMGAVVTKSIKDNQVWAGNPAREVGDLKALQKQLNEIIRSAKNVPND